MAITLDIEEYCECCSEFEPRVNRYHIESGDMSHDIYNTFITCKYAFRCDSMVKWLRKEIENGDC